MVQKMAVTSSVTRRLKRHQNKVKVKETSSPFFLKNCHPVRGPMSFTAKEGKKRNDQKQDKQAPHTVLQKLPPKMVRVSP